MKTKTKVMIKDIAKTGSKLNIYRHRWAIMYFMLYLVVGYKFIRYAVENLNFLESGFTFLKSISFVPMVSISSLRLLYSCSLSIDLTVFSRIISLPMLLVRIIRVFLKSTVLPFESVNLPSSKI